MHNLHQELSMVLQERNRKGIRNGYSCLPDEVDKRKSFRLKAVAEISISELNYLEQLELLMKYFVRPLKEQALIDDQSHTLLFGQIEMIYNLNGELLRELEKNAENVAEAFLKMAPFLKLYSVYAFDFRNALFKIQEITEKNPIFRKFLEQTESRSEVQRTLNSLMIVPIQRLPRYKLLLEQVLLYTSPSENEFKLLKESVKQIDSIVAHINSCVEEQEVTLKLLNLQNSMLSRLPNIVKPSRRIIIEGTLNKINRNGAYIKRYCVLMSDIFMYCKILKERPVDTVVKNALECCCIFPLKKCKVYELFSDSFKITCQGDGLILSSSDVQLLNTWKSCIRHTIDLHIQCRKTLRKESSKRKPTRKKNIKYFDKDCANDENKRKGRENSFYKKNFITSSKYNDENTATSGCFPCKKIGFASNSGILDRTRLHTDKGIVKSPKLITDDSQHKNLDQTKCCLKYDAQSQNVPNLRDLTWKFETSIPNALNQNNTLKSRYNSKSSSMNLLSKSSLRQCDANNLCIAMPAEINESNSAFQVGNSEKGILSDNLFATEEKEYDKFRKRVKFDFTDVFDDKKSKIDALDGNISLASRLFNFFANIF